MERDALQAAARESHARTDEQPRLGFVNISLLYDRTRAGIKAALAAYACIGTSEQGPICVRRSVSFEYYLKVFAELSVIPSEKHSQLDASLTVLEEIAFEEFVVRQDLSSH